MDLELRVDVSEMKRNCVDGDAEFFRRGLVMMAVDEELENFGLLLTEGIFGALRRTELAEEPDHPARHFRRHRPPTVDYLAERLEQSGRRRVLQKVSRGPGAERVEDIVVIVV